MSFKVGDKVKIREGGHEGTVEASNFAHSPARYLVSYTRDNGASYQDWFGEDLLQEQAAEASAPAAASSAPAAGGDGEGEPSSEGSDE